MSRRTLEVTPDLLLRAYAAGVFPMAESRRSDRLYWLDPALRGVLPLDGGFHLSRRLRRTALSDRFAVTVDQDFAGVIRGCAEPAPGRTDTWINEEIERLFLDLHARGAAHSVEVTAEGRLVGGLYGVAIGRMFYGESMFSRATDASKVALVALVGELRARHFPLIDCQMHTPLLASLGARDIPRRAFLRELAALVNYPEPPRKWSVTT